MVSKQHVGLYVELKLTNVELKLLLQLLLCGFDICLFLFDWTAKINPTEVSTCRGSFGGFKYACFQLDRAARNKTTGISYFSCDRSAASLLGGLTISKAAYINQQKPLSSDDINEWKDVKIHVIDEVSFMSDSILKTLNNKLMDIGNRTTSFGGLSIIFAGDFRQLEPVCSKESKLMFSTESSMFWKRIINAIIILDNDHSFKEDQEYGKMLKRMWEGDLTIEDREKINTRVIGHNGLELPSMLKGEYQTIIFQNNLFFYL